MSSRGMNLSDGLELPMQSFNNEGRKISNRFCLHVYVSLHVRFNLYVKYGMAQALSSSPFLMFRETVFNICSRDLPVGL